MSDGVEIPQARCKLCSEWFEPMVVLDPWEEGKVLARSEYCVRCSAMKQREVELACQAERKAERDAAWCGVCPREYCTTSEGGLTDMDRLRREHSKVSEAVEAASLSRGFYIVGQTGSGKTRAAWRLLRRHFDAGRTVRWLTGQDFDFQRKQAEHEFRVDPWIDKLAAAGVLFVDDFGKGQWNQACFGVFFELVDRRFRENRPMVFTSNWKLSALMDRRMTHIPEEDKAALVRRIREKCDGLVV